MVHLMRLELIEYLKNKSLMIIQIIDVITAITIIAGVILIVVCCFMKDDKKYKQRNKR